MLRSPKASRFIRFLAGLVLVALMVGEAVLTKHSFDEPSFVGQLDNYIYDNRLRIAQRDGASDAYNQQIVIVDIDELSIAKLGRWPWSRTVVASLIDGIARQNPSVIGLDIVFAEAQADDSVLAEALTKAPVVLGYYFANDSRAPRVGVLPPALYDELSAVTALQQSAWGATTWNSFAGNVPSLAGTAAAGESGNRPAGFINPIVDADGVVRRLPVLAQFEGKLYESFALAVLRSHLKANIVGLKNDKLLLSSPNAKEPKARIPLSEGLSALIPFSQRSGVSTTPETGRFRYISAAQFFDANARIPSLANKIVLVGTSAIGIADLRATPVNRVLPGVESHATLIAGALDSIVKQRPVDASIKSAILMAVVGSLIAAVLAMLGPSGVLLVSFVAAASLVVAFGSVFNSMHWWLPSASAFLLLALLTVSNLLLGYWGEGRAKRAMKNLFGEYVPSHLVDQMSQQPALYSNMRSENRELTILFTDVRGFTRIAETMEPERLREYMNDYLTAMTEVIHRHGGTVDKYIGDAVMAFWGAPLRDDLHADHAVSAGLQMLQEAERLSIEFERRGLPPLAIGIGINTGVVRVGDMGSRLRRAYTVLGDAVNLAARFEALTKSFNVPMIMGETTALKITRSRATLLARTQIQGRSETVNVYFPSELSNLVVRTVPSAMQANEAHRTRL